MPIAVELARPVVAKGLPDRIPYLDGWRGGSILAVMVGHFLLGEDSYVSMGPFGVELFFVLSGRLMADILFVEGMLLPTFFRRRLSRIYPGLLVFVITLVVAGAVLGPVVKFNSALAVPALTFTYNYTGALGYRTGALDHVWSLCVEEHAYLLLGAVAVLVRRYALPALPIIAAIAALSIGDGIVSTALLGQDWFTAYWRTDAHVGSILASAAIYLAIRNQRSERFEKFAGLIAPTSFAIAVILMSRDMPLWLNYSIGPIFLSLAVNTLDYLPKSMREGLSWQPLRFFGITSYSIYLWQQPFYKAILGHGTFASVAGLVAAMAIGIMAFVVVEQPLRRWLNKRGRQELPSLALTPTSSR